MRNGCLSCGEQATLTNRSSILARTTSGVSPMTPSQISLKGRGGTPSEGHGRLPTVVCRRSGEENLSPVRLTTTGSKELRRLADTTRRGHKHGLWGGVRDGIGFEEVQEQPGRGRQDP